MMVSAFFALAATAHVAFLLLTMRIRAGGAEWIVRLLLLGLIADNVILALSALAFEQSWYHGASWLRYIAHVLLLPPLAYAALLLAQRAGIEWATQSPARWACIAFVVVAILFGLGTEIADLQLVQASLFGHDRYVSADAMPPIATILTNVVILVLSAAVWRKVGWPWLFLPALTILLVNGAAAGQDWGIIAGNLAEIVFLAGWVASLRHLQPERTE
ncbi:MAG: hypothetical protein ACR2QX_15595 [Woeseiaceae bacterium]